MKTTPLRRERVLRIDPGGVSRADESLAEEVPVALVYNGRSHAVMMATPADLDDFAYGFTLAEGIVDEVDQIEIVDRLHTADGIALQMLIPQRFADGLDARQRNLTGRTGCGLCGASTLAAAIRPLRHVSAAPAMSSAEILDGLAELAAAQPLNDDCGALHAAGFMIAGQRLLAREDVGRHNAIDKLVGAAARAHFRPRALLVTSRASYEVVHKAAQFDVALVVAISAPTAMARRMARDAGITLVGFAREDRMTVYTGALSDVSAAVGEPCLTSEPP